MNNLPFSVTVNLNTEEILQFSQIFHLIFFIQLSLEIVDTDYVLAENNEIVHSHCDDNAGFFINVDT